MESSFFELNLVYGTPILFLGSAITFISLVPQKYAAWKKTGKSYDFSTWVFFALFGVFMLSLPFMIYLAWARQFLDAFSAKYDSNWITIPVFGLLFAAVPAINRFFRKFLETKKAVYFCLSVLMAVFVLFFFTFAFVGIADSLKFWVSQ